MVDQAKQDPKGTKDDGLTKEHGARSEDRATGSITFYEFEDGTSAKAWDTTKGHVSVLVLDADGRGTNGDLSENVTIAAANDIIGKAAQVAKDNVAKDEAAN